MPMVAVGKVFVLERIGSRDGFPWRPFVTKGGLWPPRFTSWKRKKSCLENTLNQD